MKPLIGVSIFLVSIWVSFWLFEDAKNSTQATDNVYKLAIKEAERMEKAVDYFITIELCEPGKEKTLVFPGGMEMSCKQDKVY